MVKRVKRVSLEVKQRRFGYIFVFPFIIGSVVFILIPLFQSIYFSFCTMTATETGYQLSFIGFGNYKQVFAVDPNFRQQLFQSLQNMFVNVPVAVLFAFFVASILNQNFKGRGIARVILFLPVIISSGIIVLLSQNDLMNQVIQTGNKTSDVVGQGQNLAGAFVNMLNQFNVDMRIIDFVVGAVSRIYDITNMSAVPIVILLAALQTIPPSIFEASYIEGATKWEVFWKICFPMVGPHLLVSVIYSIIDSFTNVSNKVISVIHDKNFVEIKYGIGSAMALSYMVLIFAIIAAVYFFISKRIFYQDR